MFSQRTGWGLEENRLHRLARQRRAVGGLLDLTVTNPTRCGFEYPPIALPSRSEYLPDPKGLLSAREAIAAYYAERGLRVSPDQLALTASTSEAYAHLFRLLCDAGDAVAMPTPSYPLFEMLAQAHDVRLEPMPMFYDDGWHLDLAASSAKAILLVHPNNPTGSYLKPREWRAVQALGIPVVVDEVFYDFALPPHRPVALDYEHAPALTFVLNGLSKVSALPQMKLGWIAVFGPEAQRREALARLEVVNDLFLSAATPIQRAAAELLQARRRLQPQIMDRLRANLAVAGLPPFPALRAEGGWSAVLRLPRVRTDEEWAEVLCERHGVLVHPGHFYGFTQEGHIVVSLLTPPAEFLAGLERIRHGGSAGMDS